MSDTPVLVRQLRLQAGRGAPAQGVRARVEDALRISSKPPALAHAFVLLRRLRLRMPAGASAQSVALQLEARWRQLAAMAVPIATAADDADAVWAADEAQARLALLQRWLQGAPATAWFWQRLLPGVPPTAPLAQRLQALLCSPLAATAAAGHEAATLQTLAQARLWRQAAPLLRAAGQGQDLPAALSPMQTAAWRAVVDAGEPEATAAVRGVDAALRAGDAWGSARAATWPRDEPAPSGDGTPRPTALPHEPVADHPPSAEPTHATPLVQGATAVPQGSGPAPAAIAPPSRQPPAFTHLAPTLADAPQALPLPSPEATAWAGLWFLLPMLRAAGLDTAPDTARTLALLLRQLDRRLRFDAPVQGWIDALSERSEAAAAPPAAHATAALWQRSLRLQALQATRLPLRRVLHRPGRLLIAPHRVDVLLPLSQADIRLRRAGFDIDPGYLPWLDTIVHFHYLR